jgi:hypothetical protein
MYWQKTNLPVILSIVWTFSERICYGCRGAWKFNFKWKLPLTIVSLSQKFEVITCNMDYVEIWVFNINDDLDCVLLGCDTVKSGGWYEWICRPPSTSVSFSTYRSLNVAVQGPALWPPLYIHTSFSTSKLHLLQSRRWRSSFLQYTGTHIPNEMMS